VSWLGEGIVRKRPLFIRADETSALLYRIETAKAGLDRMPMTDWLDKNSGGDSGVLTEARSQGKGRLC